MLLLGIQNEGLHPKESPSENSFQLQLDRGSRSAWLNTVVSGSKLELQDRRSDSTVQYVALRSERQSVQKGPWEDPASHTIFQDHRLRSLFV